MAGGWNRFHHSPSFSQTVTMSEVSSSSGSVPRAVGLFVLLAAAASILFVSQSTDNDVFHRLLKGSDDKETEVAYHKVAKSSKDSSAPLFLQDDTGSHAVKLLMQKFGMTQSKSASRKPEKSAPAGKQNFGTTTESKKSSKKSSKAVDVARGDGVLKSIVTDSKGDDVVYDTWVFAEVSSTKNCGANLAQGAASYVNGGIKADTCIPITGGTSMMVTCNDNGVSMYNYASNNCAGKVASSSVVASIGCQLPVNTPWGVMTDDDNYSDSINISCVQADSRTGPVVGDTHYDVYAGFLDKCTPSSFYYFEAYHGDTCIPFEVYTGKVQKSAMFKYGGDGSTTGTYVKLYSSNQKCLGAKQKVYMPMSCTMSTQWLYYWASNNYN